MKYINLFETQAEYDAAEKYYPNVSYIEATDEVVYQEIDPTLIVAKFTTTSVNQRIQITYKQQLCNSISIDGVDQTISTGAMNYTFATAGEHEVIYKLTDPTVIGDEAFRYCNHLTSITIPNSVTTIGSSAFYECNSLTSITFTNSVTVIGFRSFYNCTVLTSITSLNTIPPTIYNVTFENVPATCLIYVPSESVEAYKAAQYWSDRADYIQAIQ